RSDRAPVDRSALQGVVQVRGPDAEDVVDGEIVVERVVGELEHGPVTLHGVDLLERLRTLAETRRRRIVEGACQPEPGEHVGEAGHDGQAVGLAEVAVENLLILEARKRHRFGSERRRSLVELVLIALWLRVRGRRISAGRAGLALKIPGAVRERDVLLASE